MRRSPSSDAVVKERLIAAVCGRLAAGKRVRRTLPVWGRLHIDRQLPFLAVYRRPVDGDDEGTHRLITSEASYLFAPGDRALHRGLASLVRGVTTTICRVFGGFLILELSAGSAEGTVSPSVNGVIKPGFRVIVPPDESLDVLVTSMVQALGQVKVRKRSADVEVARRERVAPRGLPAWFTLREAGTLHCTQVGLEVRPIYRDPETGTLFPLVLRDLERVLARALHQIFFIFAKSHTTHRPAHFHGMGRQAMVKAVWEVDRLLADVASGFDFLLQVTPANAQRAWTQFVRHRYRKAPVFQYRPLPVDPVLLKRQLYATPIERLEDPAIRHLFREKQDELDRHLTMLLDVNTKRFVHGSLQLYGGVSGNLLALANRILQQTPSRTRDETRGGTMSPGEFVKRAHRELAYYRSSWPEMRGTVQLRDDTSGLMVSRGVLLVSRESRIPTTRAEALLQHEVGTHMLTYYNGQSQPFRQLASGLAGYDALQEGLAVFSEYLVGGLTRPRLRLLAARVVAVDRMIRGATFVETFRELGREFDFERRVAFVIVMRVYRAGGLTKDAVYLKGLVELLSYLQRGGELEPLYVGKIAVEHLPIIEELRWRQILRPAPLRPRYLEGPDAARRLALAREGVTVLDLVAAPGSSGR